MRVKQLVAGIILFAVALAAAIIPYVDGYFIKQNYLEMLAAWGKESSTTTIKVADYQLGWLHSKAKVFVSTKLSTGGQTFVLDQTISHGPYLVNPLTKHHTFALGAMHTDVLLPAALKSIFVSHENVAGDIRIDTLVTFEEGYRSHFSTPVFSLLPFPGFPNINWQGITGDVDLKMSGAFIRQIDSHTLMYGVNVQSPFMNAVFQNISADYRAVRNSAGYWEGELKEEWPGFSISGQSIPVMTMKGFTLVNRFGTEANQFYNVQLQATMISFTSQDLIINPAALTLTFNHFNIDTQKKLNQTFSDSSANIGPQTFIQILTPSSTINGQLNLSTSLGKVQANALISWSPTINSVQTWDALHANTNVNVNMRLSASLLKQYYIKMYQDKNAQQPAPMSPPKDAMILKQIDLWNAQQQMTIDVALQLKDLVNTHLKADIFAKNVDQYVVRKEISKNIADQLKALYFVVYPLPVQKPVVPIEPPKAQTPEELASQKLNSLVQQGYLRVDGADYITQLTIDAGVIKFNGVVAAPNTF